MVSRLMIDIETLDIEPTAAVLSVGLVVFNDTEILYKEYHELDYIAQIAEGRTVGKSTWKWWKEQEIEAMDCMEAPERGLNTRDLVLDINRIYQEYRCKEIWSQGTFDTVIIESLMKSIGKKPAWHFGAVRDSRTLRKTFKLNEPPFSGIKHNALDDAVYQTKRVIDCFGRIK